MSGFTFPYTIDVEGKSKSERQSAAAYLNGTDRVKLEEGGEGEEKSGVEVPLSGLYLASCGYDGYVKLWSADDWQLIKAMSSEAGGRVMSVDVGSGRNSLLSLLSIHLLIYSYFLLGGWGWGADGRFMASGEWTRTFKLWSAENVSLSL